MVISTTNFRANINKYINLSEKEDVFVKKNGKNIAVASNPYKDKRAILDSILGVLPEGAAQELNDIRLERIMKKWKGDEK